MNDAKKEIMREVMKTTIPAEMQLIYLLSQSLDILVQDVDRRIKNMCRQSGYEVKNGFVGDDRSALGEYIKAIESAKFRFDKISDRINDYTFGEGGAKSFDSFRKDANEILLELMIYCNLTSEDAFKVLKEMMKKPGVGMFTLSDIKKFAEKCKIKE